MKVTLRSDESVGAFRISERDSSAHPPAAETEFRLPHPSPKRCANFGNESDESETVVRRNPRGTVAPQRARLGYCRLRRDANPTAATASRARDDGSGALPVPNA